MSQSILSQRWPWITAAGLVIGSYLFFAFVDVRLGDPRPSGSAEDIESAEKTILHSMKMIGSTREYQFA